jgi:hypothetical protein
MCAVRRCICVLLYKPNQIIYHFVDMRNCFDIFLLSTIFFPKSVYRPVHIIWAYTWLNASFWEFFFTAKHEINRFILSTVQNL